MSLFKFIPDKNDVVQDDNAPDPRYKLRAHVYSIIFESTTPAGRLFDICLSLLIFLNVICLMLESVEPIAIAYHDTFRTLDYFFMIIFSIEYLLRLYCVRNAKKYALSFYGIVDFIGVLPSYMEFLLPHSHMLMIVRSFRLLRLFRIFKMVRFLDESRYMMLALLRSFNKIIVFLFFVLLLTVFLGSLMYVVEYRYNPGFSSIPQSVYWAIVTITTVGYGDIAPVTILGKIIASFIMILGYAIIAVPTGIMSATLVSKYREMKENQNAHQKSCPSCHYKENANDAAYCSKCGSKL